MNKIIAISTNKGGVGKTSITVNLASVFYQQGKRVLIVDADNQGNASLAFGLNPDELFPTLYEVLKGEAPNGHAIRRLYAENGDEGAVLDILPANDVLAFLDIEIIQNFQAYADPFGLLNEKLRMLRADYDYILIDSPPNIGLLHGNILMAADYALIPFQPELFSTRSLIKMLESVRQFKEKNPRLKVAGIVPSMYDKRTAIHPGILDQARILAAANEVKVFDTIIPRSIQYSNSYMYNDTPLVIADPKNELSQVYRELAAEVEEVIE